jgi:hypothetical protein
VADGARPVRVESERIRALVSEVTGAWTRP